MNGSRNGFPYKVAFSDLDYTLLFPPAFGISAENHAASRQLIGRGVTHVLASGRPYQQMTAFHEGLGLGSNPIIASNGALVRHPDGTIIREVCLAEDLTQMLLEWAGLEAVTAISHVRAGVCVSSSHRWTADLDRLRQDPAVRVRFCSYKEVRGEGQLPYKIILCAEGAQLDDLAQEIFRLCGQQLNPCRIDQETLELMPVEADKVTGAQAVAEYLGLDAGRALAFGDGANDAALLRWAGCGWAMYHAHADAKAAAKRIAPRTKPEVNFAAAVSAVLAETQ